MNKTDYQAILDEIRREVLEEGWEGEVASYIPALSRVPAERFGMALRTVDGAIYETGDARERFSVQSLSKLFALTLALGFEGEALFTRVGREPSGSAFNSLVQLEYEGGIPRNPFINAGAMVVVDVLLSHMRDVRQGFLGFVRGLDHASSVDYDAEVARSEREWGHRNAALAHFLKSFDNLDNPVDRSARRLFRPVRPRDELHRADGGVPSTWPRADATRSTAAAF